MAEPGIRRGLLLWTAACLMFAASAASGEVAVADVTRVIESSRPGIAGRAVLDELRGRLADELVRYAEKLGETPEAEAELSRRYAEAEAAYSAEVRRISEILTDVLRGAAQKWLKNNKRGVTVIIPADSALAASDGADVSDELLRQMDKIMVDFTQKR